ncbi:hypothetical protein AVEN_249669-1 [Araneus ventricosus]|uniref:Uncharacterized protein n=1 Tax=Araneus ventricosus TaxID=182803 RepID=A0A4Y2PDM3_ARAVE|nr:hypothetical protein AVEN_249669-1 [Araneus ventricosus]
MLCSTSGQIFVPSFTQLDIQLEDNLRSGKNLGGSLVRPPPCTAGRVPFVGETLPPPSIGRIITTLAWFLQSRSRYLTTGPPRSLQHSLTGLFSYPGWVGSVSPFDRETLMAFSRPKEGV